MIRFSRRRPAGMTLLELTIAAALLVVVLVAAFGSLGSTQRHDRLTRERRAASQAAFDQLDLVAALDFTATPARAEFPVAVPTGRADVVGPTVVAAQEIPLRPPAAYPIPRPPGADTTLPGQVITVRDPEGRGDVDLLEVRVVVAWRAADGTTGRVDAVTRRRR